MGIRMALGVTHGNPVVHQNLPHTSKVLMVVAHVLSHKSSQVSLIEDNHVIEQISSATSHPSFRSSILPRRLYARSFGLQSSGLQKNDHFLRERRISIEDRISIRASRGECLTQLLDYPLGCRVAGHVEVQNPAPPMLNHEKAVEQLECNCWHCEEIESSDHLAMIL